MVWTSQICLGQIWWKSKVWNELMRVILGSISGWKHHWTTPLPAVPVCDVLSMVWTSQIFLSQIWWKSKVWNESVRVILASVRKTRPLQLHSTHNLIFDAQGQQPLLCQTTVWNWPSLCVHVYLHSSSKVLIFTSQMGECQLQKRRQQAPFPKMDCDHCQDTVIKGEKEKRRQGKKT